MEVESARRTSRKQVGGALRDTTRDMSHNATSHLMFHNTFDVRAAKQSYRDREICKRSVAETVTSQKQLSCEI